MELTKIEIENYKSIKSPVAITFSKDLPTVLIGKNGSGKSNILEAIERIAATNSNLSGRYEPKGLKYKVYIRLDEMEFSDLFSDEIYSEEKATFVAFSTGERFVINAIESKTIVPLLKKELSDLREIAQELDEALKVYEEQLSKIACEEYDPLHLRGYEVIDFKGNTTNYQKVEWSARFLIDQIERVIGGMSQHFSADNSFVFSFSDTFYGLEKIMLPHEEQIQFKLQYKEPQLASFEQKHITIDENAIKLEIEEINKKTEVSCKKIKELFETLQEQSESLLDTEHAGKITRFLRNVKDIFGKTCGYLLSENSQVFFKDYQKENDVRYYDPSRVIFEAFVNSHFTNEKKTEYLQNKDIELSENEIEEFARWVKEKSAKFDVGMYQDISVTVNEKNHIQILLHENTSEIVPLEQTSAGRRWYFTYCFVKDTLSRGDTFIIDEPAAMLHPSAQKEIMSDLIDLVKKCGIKAIYSTHSPYLIPNEWSCVKFVSLCEETNVTDFDLSTEEFKQFKALSSIDIFAYEEISDYYRKSSFKSNITKGIYEKLINIFSTNKEISEQIGIDERTLYYWHSAKKQISIGNIIKAAWLLKIDPLTLMKETE